MTKKDMRNLLRLFDDGDVNETPKDLGDDQLSDADRVVNAIDGVTRSIGMSRKSWGRRFVILVVLVYAFVWSNDVRRTTRETNTLLSDLRERIVAIVTRITALEERITTLEGQLITLYERP